MSLIILNEMESVAMAFEFYFNQTITNDEEFEERMKILQTLSEITHEKISRWTCAIHCMHVAGIDREKIKKIVSSESINAHLSEKELLSIPDNQTIQ